MGLKDFKIIRLIGCGQFSKVYLVQKLTGKDKEKVYAMKMIDKASIARDAKRQTELKTERKIFEDKSQLIFTTTLHYAFESIDDLYLVMDFNQGGNLSTTSILSAFDVRFVLSEVAVGLRNLHKKCIVFEDLGIDDVMLDAKGHVALNRFRSAKKLESSKACAEVSSI